MIRTASPIRSRAGRSRAGRSRRRPGFTLIELVMVIGVTIIVAGVAAPVIVEATRVHHRTAYRAAMLTQGQIALERMTREIRAMPPSDLIPTAPDLDEAGASIIRFDDLGFRLTGTTLERTQDGGSSWVPLSQDVSSLSFTYVGDSGVLSPLPLSALDLVQVRRVEIALTLEITPEVLNLFTSADLRRLGVRD